MTLPIDCSSPPVPPASSSRRRDPSPASRFVHVWTFVSELSRLPLPEGVGEVLCPSDRAAQDLPRTFLRFHRNSPVAPQFRPSSSTAGGKDSTGSPQPADVIRIVVQEARFV